MSYNRKDDQTVSVTIISCPYQLSCIWRADRASKAVMPLAKNLFSTETKIPHPCVSPADSATWPFCKQRCFARATIIFLANFGSPSSHLYAFLSLSLEERNHDILWDERLSFSIHAEVLIVTYIFSFTFCHAVSLSTETCKCVGWFLLHNCLIQLKHTDLFQSTALLES